MTQEKKSKLTHEYVECHQLNDSRSLSSFIPSTLLSHDIVEINISQAHTREGAGSGSA
jgi:hypothetical protein